MPPDFTFVPNPARARRLDGQIRSRLADSLQISVNACAGHLIFDPDTLNGALTALRSRAVRPVIFSLYAGFVEAVFADRLADAQTLLDRLLDTMPPAGGPAAAQIPRVLTLDDRGLGIGQAARYEAEIITHDPGSTHLPFNAADLEWGQANVHGALTWLAEAAPALAGETAALLREIILAHRVVMGQPETGLSGASSFFLWGAAFIKFAGRPPRLALAESLVHEAAHMLLFGFTEGAPLVTNEPKSLYNSPLRDDPRPMDGLVHAAYVLARIALYYSELLKSGILTDSEHRAATFMLMQCRQQFADADAIIGRHSNFTEIGASAYQAAKSWMTS